nr:MAG TPA: antitermination protein Q [Caudoviricetes sp.]
MTIEARLENWGRVVRDPRWQPQHCASWAKLATALGRQDDSEAPQQIVLKDVEDGWLLEQAWQTINDPLSKRLLQYHFVHRMSAEMVCRMLVRRYGASPNTLKHWKVRLAKALSVMSRVVETEEARARVKEEADQVLARAKEMGVAA